jgi:hypothetical protein
MERFPTGVLAYGGGAESTTATGSVAPAGSRVVAAPPEGAWVLQLVGQLHLPHVRVLLMASKHLGVVVRLSDAAPGSALASRTHPYSGVPSGRLSRGAECSPWVFGLPALMTALDTYVASPAGRAPLDARTCTDSSRAVLVSQWLDVMVNRVGPAVEAAVTEAVLSSLRRGSRTGGTGTGPGLSAPSPLWDVAASHLLLLEARLTTEKCSDTGHALLCDEPASCGGEDGVSWLDLTLGALLADLAAVQQGSHLLARLPRLASFLAAFRTSDVFKATVKGTLLGDAEAMVDLDAGSASVVPQPIRHSTEHAPVPVPARRQGVDSGGVFHAPAPTPAAAAAAPHALAHAPTPTAATASAPGHRLSPTAPLLAAAAVPSPHHAPAGEPLVPSAAMPLGTTLSSAPSAPPMSPVLVAHTVRGAAVRSAALKATAMSQGGALCACFEALAPTPGPRQFLNARQRPVVSAGRMRAGCAFPCPQLRRPAQRRQPVLQAAGVAGSVGSGHRWPCDRCVPAKPGRVKRMPVLPVACGHGRVLGSNAPQAHETHASSCPPDCDCSRGTGMSHPAGGAALVPPPRWARVQALPLACQSPRRWRRGSPPCWEAYCCWLPLG